MSAARETEWERRMRRNREHDELVRRFGNACAVCGSKPRSRRLHVDHDHATGAVRGLLCFTCNNRLLTQGATADRLLAASMYLRGGPRADGVSWLAWVEHPSRS